MSFAIVSMGTPQSSFHVAKLCRHEVAHSSGSLSLSFSLQKAQLSESLHHGLPAVLAAQEKKRLEDQHKAQLVQFSYLSRAQANEVQDFMNDKLGQKIKLIDQEDRAWIGFISQPQDPVVQDGRDVCTFTVSFEFQGALA